MEDTNEITDLPLSRITRSYVFAKAFDSNLRMALGEIGMDTRPVHKVDRSEKPEKPKKVYHKVCAYDKCNVPFTTEYGRVKYHTKACAVYAAKKKYLARKKQNPVKYGEMKRRKNIEWARYAFNITDAPPIHSGRPTGVKKARLTEFRNRLKEVANDARWKQRRTRTRTESNQS